MGFEGEELTCYISGMLCNIILCVDEDLNSRISRHPRRSEHFHWHERLPVILWLPLMFIAPVSYCLHF